MSKKYFVDSENVGEAWIDMYLEDAEDSEFLIFYTNHTPRIDYEHMITLMNTHKKQPEFIKCYEGNNALDFQLVSYIGYQFHEGDTDEMVIVSNDTGFDAVVHFWTDRDMNIVRIPTKGIQKADADEEETPVSEDGNAELSSVDLNSKVAGIDMKELCTVVNCIGGGKKKMGTINSAYVHLYGQQKGNEIYKHMKANFFAVPSVQWKLDTKVKKFCELICKYCNAGNISIPEDLPAYLYEQLTTKGKKTIANKINAKYGKDHGPQLNKIFKPFYTIIVEIRKQ